MHLILRAISFKTEIGQKRLFDAAMIRVRNGSWQKRDNFLKRDQTRSTYLLPVLLEFYNITHISVLFSQNMAFLSLIYRICFCQEYEKCLFKSVRVSRGSQFVAILPCFRYLSIRSIFTGLSTQYFHKNGKIRMEDKTIFFHIWLLDLT